MTKTEIAIMEAVLTPVVKDLRDKVSYLEKENEHLKAQNNKLLSIIEKSYE